MKMKRTARAGIANIWMVLILPVLVGFLGLAIDVGYMVWVAQQLQNAADAGALAGVQRLRAADIEGTREWAQAIAIANTAAGAPVQLDLNEANEGDGDIVVGRFDRVEDTFVPTTVTPNAVRITARRTGGSLNGALPLLFGPAFGFNTTNIERSAIAMFGGGTGWGLIVLGSDEPSSFHIAGSATLQVNGGDIQINSSHHHAAYFQGNGIDLNPDTTNAGRVNIVGGYRTAGNPSLPPVNEGVEPGEDPIYNMLSAYNNPAAFSPYEYYEDVLPTRNLNDFPAVGGHRYLESGHYPAGISVTGNDKLILAPGIYALDGAGLSISSNVEFTANGVLFYLMGTGSLNLAGGSAITITPIEDTIYEGMSVFQAYGNTNESSVTGNSGMDLQGSYYFPSNHLNVSGSSVQLGNQLLTSTIHISGNAVFTINYEGKDPGVGGHTFLVR